MSYTAVSLSPGEWQIMDRLWEKSPRTLMELVRPPLPGYRLEQVHHRHHDHPSGG